MHDTTWELPNSVAQRVRIERIRADGCTGRLRHCVTTAVELLGRVDEDELRTGLARLVSRRPALGSVFGAQRSHRLRGGEPSLRHHVLPAPDAEARWRAAREIADFEAQRPFALGEHPLVRGLLLTAGGDRHLFVLTTDQLVSDAWSANLLLDDILSGDILSADEATPDAYPSVWRAREDWLAGADGAATLARRREHLTDAGQRWPLPVTADEQAPATVLDRFAALDGTVADALLAKVREARGTLLAAGAIALAAMAGGAGPPLALRTTLAGREGPDEAVVGWFANEAVLRLPPRNGTVLEYATALRAEVFGALTDQRIPYDLVADALPEGAPGGPSVALVFLPGALTRGPQREYRVGDAIAQRSGVSICPTGADIDFFLLENPPPMSTTPRAALTAGVLASTDVVSPDALEQLLQRWTAALAALAAIPWSSTHVDELARGVADVRAAV